MTILTDTLITKMTLTLLLYSMLFIVVFILLIVSDAHDVRLMDEYACRYVPGLRVSVWLQVKVCGHGLDCGLRCTPSLSVAHSTDAVAVCNLLTKWYHCRLPHKSICHQSGL